MIDTIFLAETCRLAAWTNDEPGTSLSPLRRFRAKDVITMPITSSARTQVLIVGGSLVGLSAALFLAARGVATIVVEKHRGSSAHPRAIGFTELTLEHYRAVGVADRIPKAPADTRLRRAKVESLTGAWYEETP